VCAAVRLLKCLIIYFYTRQNDEAMEEIYGANSGPIEPWPVIVPEQQVNVLKEFYKLRVDAEDMLEVSSIC
jgi:hypothetical protein